MRNFINIVTEKAGQTLIVETYLTTIQIEGDYTGAKFPVEVFKNPSRKDFLKGLNDTNFHCARGNLYPDGTLLVFYEEEAEHYPVSYALGKGEEFIRLFLKKDRVIFYSIEFDDELSDMTVEEAIEMFRAAPALQRIYGRNFEVVGD